MTRGTGMSDDGDDVLARFRQADPASAVEPDPAALRAATDRRIADPSFVVVDPPSEDHRTHDGATPDDGDAHPGRSATASAGSPGRPADDDAAAPAQRRTSRSGWVVAAAVATMLAVGVGGYIAGTQRSEGPLVFTESGQDSAGVEDASAPQWDAGSDSDSAAEDPESAAEAPESLASQGDRAPDVALRGEAGSALPVQFVDGGLPTEARQGDAWIHPADDDAELVVLGEYPVISAADAVTRLGDPRFTPHLWPLPVLQDRADPPPTPEPGAPLAWPAHEVRLVAAELTVGGYTYDGGDIWVLPTWILTDDQGQAWSVLAVAEEALDIS